MNKQIKIVLCSDNHGLREPIQYLKNTYGAQYCFFHCGDSEMYPDELRGFAAVRGNNDPMGSYPDRRVVDLGDHRILVTHGHLDMFFRQWDMLAERAKAQGCDIVFFGHTHIYMDEEVNGVRLLNPGSMWHNRDGSAPSYMIVTLDGKKITAERRTWNFSMMK